MERSPASSRVVGAAVWSWLTSSAAGALSAAGWGSGALQVVMRYLCQQTGDECRPSLALMLFEKSILLKSGVTSASKSVHRKDSAKVLAGDWQFNKERNDLNNRNNLIVIQIQKWSSQEWKIQEKQFTKNQNPKQSVSENTKLQISQK